MPTPRISVLLPTRNRPAQATLSIRSALRQDVTAPFEVVVAENYDDDTPAQALRREFTGDGRVRVIRTGGLALDENWEAALAAADGEYLMLISDKCLLRRSALSRMLDACEAQDCLAATAPMAAMGRQAVRVGSSACMAPTASRWSGARRPPPGSCGNRTRCSTGGPGCPSRAPRWFIAP